MSRFLRTAVVLLSFLPGFSRPATAGSAELLADIKPLPPTDPSTEAEPPLLPLGQRLLFVGREPAGGSEPWISDGTFSGTRRLADLRPGGDSSELTWLGTVRQTAVFLRRLEGPPWEKRYELWRSDGTAAGTFPLFNTGPVNGSCGSSSAGLAAVAGNRLVFFGRGPDGCGLWTTDGTVAGTRFSAFESSFFDEGEILSLVATGNRVFLAADSGRLLVKVDDSAAVLLGRFEFIETDGPRELTVAGSRLAFIAQAEEGGGEELWISDGTPAGTRAVTRFFEPSPLIGFFHVEGNTLLFGANDGTGPDLWQVDVTGGEPRRVTDFIGGGPSSAVLRLGNRLVFVAREEGRFRLELWVSGGTPSTTTYLDGCAGGCPQVAWEGSLTQIGNKAIFSGLDGKLWVTDGTGAGTRPIATTQVLNTPDALLGKAFFIGSGIGSGSSSGRALWRTDGTAEGTFRLMDLKDSSLNPDAVAAGGRAFFLASPDRRGAQLWVSDGTPGGTRALTFDIAGAGSSPEPFAPVAAGAVFSAADSGRHYDYQRHLWCTDGTSAGTFAIPAVTNPASITPAAGGLAFFRAAAASSISLWRSDGTESGTFPVSPAGVRVTEILAPYRNGVLFRVGEDEPISLWESDGTAAGTRPLFDLPADITSARGFRAFGSQLYFFARPDGESRFQLWVSSGTAGGTRPVSTEQLFSLSGSPGMAQVGGTVFFTTRYGLWKTDGTAAGTAELLSAGDDEGRPTDLTEFQGVLYFMAGRPEDQEQRALWKSDGTPGGTVLIADVGHLPATGTDSADFLHLLRLGDRLIFPAEDATHGVELWASDGTAAGTALVRDILPGAASSMPHMWLWRLTDAGSKVYFTATDGTSGFEPWESDGTAGGTRRAHDIAPGDLSSSPDGMVVSGNRLYFGADDGVHGDEPWALTLQAAACTPSATALCLGGRFRVEADWRDFAGNRGRGHAAGLTADTGTFWFFDAANVEVILKVLDGRSLNGHHWVFYGALSNVEYVLTVTDTQTGAVRRYVNPPGALGSLADTEAFGPRGATLAGVVTEGPPAVAWKAPAAARSLRETGACVPGAEKLCLNQGRFAVEAHWRKPDGTRGTGQAVPLAGGDTGYLWFFQPDNVEVVLKVLDGRPVNGKFWVFYGALSDVEYTLTVTDTETGATRSYTNPKGRLASVADTGAF